ncbi:uncharacterized protein PV06_07420 [Exophiala oligosperma]|uniref:Uncharacterized protein n=2 Tax=Chaetothyriales TaxID=34395 RepID=A0A0D2BRX0_9EURO|nr:uncharacterized protein PV06_07420 [Exophiala oligosperma]KAJ9639023.1 hypothetical protein H2204_003931 [Knufia peltigerae]KIW40202.1 hypothetical protein PV06_07420 [Exophiala oligosperma]
MHDKSPRQYTAQQDSDRQEQIEMDDGDVRRNSSRQRLLEAGRETNTGTTGQGVVAGLARHTLGLMLLLLVVFLWTLSNFLGSSIFADNTYAKPFFLTYLNTSMFMLAMIPTLLRIGYRRQRDHGDLYMRLRGALSGRGGRGTYRRLSSAGDRTLVDPEGSREDEAFLAAPDDPKNPSQPEEGFLGSGGQEGAGAAAEEEEEEEKERAKHLDIASTARLALTFCILWFGANYFAMACLQHTTVASTTILTSTSSIWTLLIGAFTGTERFTWRKLLGVLGSLVGIVLISHVDLSAASPENVDGDGGSPSSLPLSRRAVDVFPDKPASEMMLGNAMALLSAVIYGLYTITLKRTTVKALPRSLNMPLFFGLVGLWNIVLSWPLFPILHYSGLERFVLPPTGHIWTILLVNSVSSLLSDICWAYAMVLTSPLVVTVGLSLTIPLSLVGEMVLQGRYEGVTYWIGAAIVVGSFVFVDHEEREEEPPPPPEVAAAANQAAAMLPPPSHYSNHDRGVALGTEQTTKKNLSGGPKGATTAAAAVEAASGPSSNKPAPLFSPEAGPSEDQKRKKKRPPWNRLLSGGGPGGGHVSSDDDDDDDFWDSDSD